MGLSISGDIKCLCSSRITPTDCCHGDVGLIYSPRNPRVTEMFEIGAVVDHEQSPLPVCYRV